MFSWYSEKGEPTPPSIEYVMRYRLHDISGYSIRKYRLSGDYEQISTHLVCNFVMREAKAYAYPLHCKTDLIIISQLMSSIQQCMRKLNQMFTLDVREIQVDNPDELKQNETLLISFVAYTHLLRAGYMAYATSCQFNGVVAKNIDESSLQVIALSSCVIEESGGLISFCVSVVKVTRLIESAIIDPSFRAKLIFMPNSDDVEFISLHTIDLKGETHKEDFLTSLDELNRRHGYNKYIPDNSISFCMYWSLAYGVECSPSASSLKIAVIKNSYYTRAVPLQTLAMGTVDMTDILSRKQLINLEETITTDFHKAMKSCSLFSNLDSPVTAKNLALQHAAKVAAASIGSASSVIDAVDSDIKTIFRTAKQLKATMLKSSNSSTVMTPIKPNISVSVAETNKPNPMISSEQPKPNTKMQQLANDSDDDFLFQDDSSFVNTVVPNIVLSQPSKPPISTQAKSARALPKTTKTKPASTKKQKTKQM